jgi:hypothetical protein
MVKTLLVFLMAARVLLLEIAAITLISTGFGLWFGTPAVLVTLGVAALVKAFELDMGKE